MKRRDFLAASGMTTGSLYAQSAGAASESRGNEFTRPRSYAMDPAYIDERIDSRSISAENPTGARGGGGKAGRGRKGRPCRILGPGEKVVLADIKGSGTIRHIWMSLGELRPEVARALRFEVFYDGLTKPSISTPVLDFFGLPHGRVAEYYSAMISANEGRGLNSHMPMPFARSIRAEVTNESARYVVLFYQIDYTLEPSTAAPQSYLHASFRRENLTTLQRDFVIAEGLKGPGRFLGCAVGIRVLDKQRWYGEGEVKIYRDGDRDFPTICGTGLEDYIGSGHGLGRHYGLYAGAPINIPAPPPPERHSGVDFVSFYRWHVPDPIMFTRELKVTIQQIGLFGSMKEQDKEFQIFKQTRLAAGPGWLEHPNDELRAIGMYERVDDYCATAFVYCREPQSIARYETQVAIKDVAWLPGEKRLLSAATENDREKLFENMKKSWNW